MWAFDMNYAAYVVLWCALILALPISFVIGLIYMWGRREKRDGKR